MAGRRALQAANPGDPRGFGSDKGCVERRLARSGQSSFRPPGQRVHSFPGLSVWQTRRPSRINGLGRRAFCLWPRNAGGNSAGAGGGRCARRLLASVRWTLQPSQPFQLRHGHFRLPARTNWGKSRTANLFSGNPRGPADRLQFFVHDQRDGALHCTMCSCGEPDARHRKRGRDGTPQYQHQS